MPSPRLRMVFFQPCALGTCSFRNFLDVPEDKNLGQASGSRREGRAAAAAAHTLLSLFARGFLIAGSEPVSPACKTRRRALSPLCLSLAGCVPGCGTRGQHPGSTGVTQGTQRGHCPLGASCLPGCWGRHSQKEILGAKSLPAAGTGWCCALHGTARAGSGDGEGWRVSPTWKSAASPVPERPGMLRRLCPVPWRSRGSTTPWECRPRHPAPPCWHHPPSLLLL